MPIQVRVLVNAELQEGRRIDLLLHQDYRNKLNLPSHFYYTLEHGGQQVLCFCQIGNVGTPMLKVDQQTAQQLSLYDGQQLHLKISSRGRLLLGPILGILVSRHYSNTPEQLFGNLTTFCHEVSTAAQARYIETIIFTPEQLLKATDHRMEAFVYRHGIWSMVHCPLPHLVYNRLSSRIYEHSEAYQQLKAVLKRHHIPMFNENFLDKWQIHQTFAQQTELQPHLPTTTMFQNKASLRQMLKKYAILYLKPIHGSMGRGIYRIQRLTQVKNPYLLQYMTLHGLQQRSYPTFQRLIDSLRVRMKQPYLIQQGLLLIKQHGSTVDFRALVQKNGNESWSITSLVARFGSSNSIVSNVARGGHALNAQQALQTLHGWKGRAPTIQQLRQMALRVAEIFDQSIDGDFAELGIDLGVDIYGKIWILEVNSKPSKTDDTLLQERTITRPSVRKMLQYVLHRTQFLYETPASNSISGSLLQRRKRLGR